VGQREGFRKLGLRLQFDDSVVEHLLRIGFHPQFGARPLQRAIEESVGAKLAHFIVNHPNLRNTNVRIELRSEADCQVVSD
jgi:ATP-dependent Clp protease ATP-binding subunit ClpC